MDTEQTEMDEVASAESGEVRPVQPVPVSTGAVDTRTPLKHYRMVCEPCILGVTTELSPNNDISIDSNGGTGRTSR